MTKIRDDLIRALWRGRDPFAGKAIYRGSADLQGWASQHHYLGEAIAAIRPSVIVEVGVWKGGSTIHMASRLRDLGIDGVVVAVDTWHGAWDHWVQDHWFAELGIAAEGPSLFDKFLNNVRQMGLTEYIVPIPLDSINAAQVLRHFKIHPNMVHIDAGHDYEAVTADLQQWWPMLAPGGVLVGDDYRDGNDWPGVKLAFDSYFEPMGLVPIENADDKCRLFKPVEAETYSYDAIKQFDRIGSDVDRWRETCRLEFTALAEGDFTDLDELIRRYVQFVGPKWEGARLKIINKIVSELNRRGINCNRHDLFTEDGAIRANSSAEILGRFSNSYFRPGSLEEFQCYELLSASPNHLYRMALPDPINKNMAKSERPPLRVYAGRGLDLFVSPLGYQLCDRQRAIYWPQASTRSYSTYAFDLPNRIVARPVVIVQDTFEGSNFSHFLFDWLPRLSHFLSANLVDRRSCIFLMGGAPAEFHALLIANTCNLCGLSLEQFVFPSMPEMWRLEGPVYFFSDISINIMHPAHMAHERSIDFIRKLTGSIHTQERRVKRLYISRRDTPLRRLANEDALWKSLKARGFAIACLSAMPITEQLELVRGAAVIVAPHGMGLTHIAFHGHAPLIIELHHPVVGTDAYAFIARALGFRYRALLGKSVDSERHHFEIPVEDVITALFEEGVTFPEEASSASDFDHEPTTEWFGGTQVEKAHQVSDIPPIVPAEVVLKHVRSDPVLQPDNNVGWTQAENLCKGLVYSAACEIWIPKEFRGSAIGLHSEDFGRPLAVYANLERRDQWQTLCLDGAAKGKVANFVLRLSSSEGAAIYSTRWRVAAGAPV